TRMADKPKAKGFGLHVNQGKVHVHLTNVWTTDAIRIETEEKLEAKQWHHLVFAYDGSRMAEGVHVFIDGKPAKLEVQNNTLYRPFRNAGSKFREAMRIGGGWGADRRFKGLIDEVRVYARVLRDEEIAALASGKSLNELAAAAGDSPQLRWYFLEHAAPEDIRTAWKRLNTLLEEKEKLERTFPTVMVMAESPVPKETHLLLRGAYDKPGEKVSPGLPAVLPPLPGGAPNNRLGFAQWLIDPSNPLTARVAVNRFWQILFGVGLVKTVEDFGVQGEPPSNPELLDWLATEFMRSGWDVKGLLKLIVTSATYRQSSAAPAELLQRDPDNRLLARGPRHRLPAEMIRDQALLAAGLLVEKIGGPSVKPYQPAGLWKEVVMQDMDYAQARGEDLYRRSLYTFWKRTVAPPMMVNFDAAQRESCVVREQRTNTPLQALNLMNDVTFVEAARFIGQRMMKEGGVEPAARLRYGLRLVLGRAPSPEEERILRENLNFHLDYFGTDAKRAQDYLSHGESAVDPALDKRELAAYASVASLILNMDEAVTKE
ncbi:MAG: DUF1553 domain-containing protein, partial [Acidobacteria bacterium]|nr:DUF1553 domain-containing protein [Acidobacteriota bacterium]